MPTERLYTAITIFLLAVSVVSTIAAVHFYQSTLAQLPQPVGSLGDIAGSSGDILNFDQPPADFEVLVSQFFSQNSTLLMPR